MKKIIVLFIMILMPISIYAYSKNIIPGGESIGIKIEPNGLIVVGFYKVDGVYIAKNNIKIGDAITKINGKSVTSINVMPIKSREERSRIAHEKRIVVLNVP